MGFVLLDCTASIEVCDRPSGFTVTVHFWWCWTYLCPSRPPSDSPFSIQLTARQKDKRNQQRAETAGAQGQEQCAETSWTYPETRYWRWHLSGLLLFTLKLLAGFKGLFPFTFSKVIKNSNSISLIDNWINILIYTRNDIYIYIYIIQEVKGPSVFELCIIPG